MTATTDHPPSPAPGPSAAEPLLDVRGLCVDYLGPGGPETDVRACTDIDFTLGRGEIFGIAGESGSGKSTLITALARLQRPPATTTAGRMLLHGADGAAVDLLSLSERELRRLRWDDIAVVLQSAMDALNPVMRLHAQFADVLREHRKGIKRDELDARITELLSMVGITPDRARAYPHELSGGMRQRASIALALACEPSLVIMDEPTTAVDVVMQRQIMGQILRLRDRIGFAVVLVTHDLSLLLEVADRIAIMYAGRIVETGAATSLYLSPEHPYTQGLRDSFPPLHAPLQVLHGIPGTPPDLKQLPDGCAFAPRCAHTFDRCRTERPLPVLRGSRVTACHLPEAEGTTQPGHEPPSPDQAAEETTR
ncbi:ABC transporter ATP-binding protein [Streptomyces sp. NBC_00370]|uniref:ABC transporter ATP-binding protein n=1 Tax=Streptomyces sp. NBC_00370 TaxID=2975728 RepID=UPI002E255BF0